MTPKTPAWQLEYIKRWKAENKDKVRAQSKRQRERIKNDPVRKVAARETARRLAKKRQAIQGVAEKLKEQSRKYNRSRPRKRQDDKARARTLLNYHVRVGNVSKQPCRECGAINVEAHHADYSKPLDVIWLCHKHHVEFHLNERRIEEMARLTELLQNQPTTQPTQ